jgi:hypothetical protein
LGVVPGNGGQYDVVAQFDARHKVKGVHQVHTRAGVGDPLGSLAAAIADYVIPRCVNHSECIWVRLRGSFCVLWPDGGAGGEGGWVYLGHTSGGCGGRASAGVMVVRELGGVDRVVVVVVVVVVVSSPSCVAVVVAVSVVRS